MLIEDDGYSYYNRTGGNELFEGKGPGVNIFEGAVGGGQGAFQPWAARHAAVPTATLSTPTRDGQRVGKCKSHDTQKNSSHLYER